MSRRGIVAALALIALAAAVATHFAVDRRARDGGRDSTSSEVAAHYQCPMHPQIVSDQPGTCPICGMNLQRVEDAARTPPPSELSTHEAARVPKFYRHPMRSDVVSPVPAKDEMGMDYVPVYDDDGAGTPANDVPGHAPFTLSPERRQLIGVTTAPVERRPLALEIRAVGRVAYDPKLYQALVEYREAARSRHVLHESTLREAQAGADALVRGASLRLRQLGLGDDQIAALTRDGSDPTALLLPGKSVWIYAQVYEHEAPLVRLGQTMTVTSPALPGTRFPTTVTAIDPILDPTTRTMRVRGLVATPEANLRPESFVDVVIAVPLGEQLAVPEDAVLDTGERALVFVVHDDGTFEPRAVELGQTAAGYAEVRSGLAEGERVVTSANFLIDSESRFRSALAAFRHTH
jgi:hypothetical protein